MKDARGFVLVNALVMVAALAAVAVLLLSRAEAGRVQAAAAQEAAQLELYLDSFEALVRVIIDSDPGPADHLAEAWAQADYNVPLDHGRVAGDLSDLQAGFNVNWLANPEGIGDRAAFDRLANSLGVPPRVSNRIVAALVPGGVEGALGSVAENLPGGAVLMLDQLPVSGGDYSRLRPYLAAVPGDSRLNVNTAPPAVLAAFLPGVSPAAMAGLIRDREAEPFVSVEDFTLRVAAAIGAEKAAGLEADRFSIGSDWFAAEFAAELDGRVASRRIVLRRNPLPVGAQVAYRLDKW